VSPDAVTIDSRCRHLIRMTADRRIHFLQVVEIVTRKEDRLIDRNRQTAMTSSDHDGAEDELAEGVPCTGEGVGLVRQADGYSNCAVCWLRQSVDFAVSFHFSRPVT
jgi:hypothetical protein